MKWNSKRSIARLLAIVMLVGSSMTIHANELESDQTADTHMEEDNDKSDVVRVILPTDAIEIFDFILDPQGLIQATNGAAYEGNTFEKDATLFFKRTDEDAQENYSSTSDAVKVANKGLTPVDVVVAAKIATSSVEGFAMSDDREFTDDTRASLYLALTDGETTVPIMVDEEASLSISIPAASEDGEGENIYSFWLTGASNSKGDWSRLKEIAPEVTVTWEVTSNETEAVSEEEDPPENDMSSQKESENLPDAYKEEENSENPVMAYNMEAVPPSISNSNVAGN